jgi:flagellar hook-length control protein FliK
MNSGVQMAAVDPLALLLGLGGQKISPNPEGTPGFGDLLNLAPSPTAAGGEPSPIVMNPGKDADSQPGDMIPIVIPGEILSLLGQAAVATPDSGSNVNQQQLPGGPVMARAELMAPDDRNGDMVYVRIQMPGNSDSVVPETSDNDGGQQEMILPMRLRTVEHRGGRLIADGEMLTAAGKDVPIRLQLQVAENPQTEQPVDTPDPQTSTQASAGKAAGGNPSLARMLADLNAEMIVVEPAAAETTPLPRMPFADIMGRPERAVKNGNAAPSPITVDAATASAKPIGTQGPTPVLPQAPTTATISDMSSTASADIPAADQDIPDMVDQIVGRDGSSSATAKSDGGAMPAASTLTATSGTSGIDGTPQQSSGAPQVRFYDLDHKLDQLKLNAGQRIKIQLVPSNLGKMELSIVSHRGLVTVNLAVESAQAKQAVEKNLPQLEQRLASSGIKVDAVQLQVNHPTRGTTFANTHQHYYQGGHGGRGGRGSQQSPYRSTHHYRMQTPDSNFSQELVNCLA